MKRSAFLFNVLFLTGVIFSLSMTAQAGSLSGIVRSGLGDLIEGAMLTLSPGGYTATSNVTGTYLFASVPDGNYTLSVTATGYEPYAEAVTVLPILPTVKDVNMTSLTGTLTGVVRDGVTPISGAVVTLEPGGYTATTGLAGTFSISDIPVGEYTMSASATGYEPWSMAKSIVGGSNLQDVDLVTVTGTLTGLVRDGVTPISGAVVTLEPGGYTATTGLAGTFSISDIPVGEYTMSASAAGYQPWSMAKTIVGGSNLQDVDLVPITATLTGVVRDGVTPISGAVVTLEPGGYTATTGLAGTFSISDIPVGEYTMSASATGYQPWSMAKTIVGGSNLQDVDLVPITATLTGVV
ncbi:MAG: hypothetical protein GXY07_14990, partial [Candidatus Hydrogenedentes bacterium]|nr:hypothetical protein [Candidatus Hydrogenedentota bacterium]